MYNTYLCDQNQQSIFSVFCTDLKKLRWYCRRYRRPQGVKHAESAFVDKSCCYCSSMTIAVLRLRLQYLRRGGVPLPMPRSSSSSVPQKRATSANRQGDLRVTVGENPPNKSPWAPHSSSITQAVELPGECAGPSHGGPAISFGAPADDQMSIAALEGELESGEEDSPALPPLGRVALPEPDPELTAMLSQAAKAVGLKWREPPCPEPSKLDDWYLGDILPGSA